MTSDSVERGCGAPPTASNARQVASSALKNFTGCELGGDGGSEVENIRIGSKDRKLRWWRESAQYCASCSDREGVAPPSTDDVGRSARARCFSVGPPILSTMRKQRSRASKVVQNSTSGGTPWGSGTGSWVGPSGLDCL